MQHRCALQAPRCWLSTHVAGSAHTPRAPISYEPALGSKKRSVIQVQVQEKHRPPVGRMPPSGWHPHAHTHTHTCTAVSTRASATQTRAQRNLVSSVSALGQWRVRLGLRRAWGIVRSLNSASALRRPRPPPLGLQRSLWCLRWGTPAVAPTVQLIL